MDIPLADSLGDEYCPLMPDGVHCECWWGGLGCCPFGSSPDPYIPYIVNGSYCDEMRFAEAEASQGGY